MMRIASNYAAINHLVLDTNYNFIILILKAIWVFKGAALSMESSEYFSPILLP